MNTRVKVLEQTQTRTRRPHLRNKKCKSKQMITLLALRLKKRQHHQLKKNQLPNSKRLLLQHKRQFLRSKLMPKPQKKSNKNVLPRPSKRLLKKLNVSIMKNKKNLRKRPLRKLSLLHLPIIRLQQLMRRRSLRRSWLKQRLRTLFSRKQTRRTKSSTSKPKLKKRARSSISNTRRERKPNKKLLKAPQNLKMQSLQTLLRLRS